MKPLCSHMHPMYKQSRIFSKRDPFDKFFKIEFIISSHLSVTGIVLNSDLTRTYHTVQLSRITGSVLP